MNATSLHLNPLTYGRLVHHRDGSEFLELRSHAKGRGFNYINVDPAKYPALFAALSAWLDGGPAHLPEIAPELELELCANGLLVTGRELAIMPQGIGPERGHGHAMAAALCPQAAAFLESGPTVPKPPTRADDSLVQRGFCLVPPVISPQDLEALRAYYRILRDSGWLKLKDNDGWRRSTHNDPLARVLHKSLTPYLSALTGREIRPSFSYASHYADQTLLRRHSDRAQCEFTFSMPIEYDPATSNDICSWPLLIHAPEGDIALHQQFGGGAIFHGHRLEHSRPPLPAGHRAQFVFLCFVQNDFTEELD